MQEDGPSVCELCGGKLGRVRFPTGIISKGSGFYRNDARASSSSTTSESDTKAGSGKDAGSAPDKGPGSKSKTPDGGSSGSKTSPTDASST